MRGDALPGSWSGGLLRGVQWSFGGLRWTGAGPLPVSGGEGGVRDVYARFEAQRPQHLCTKNIYIQKFTQTSLIQWKL